MASRIANFASCLGKYDATFTGAAFSLDVSGAIGTSDLSLNSGYLTNSTGFVMPAATTGNGISFTGWFNPTVAEPSNYTPIFDVSCGGTQSITLCVSGNSLSPVLVGNFNGNQVYGTTATANTWNFFAYTICCSGSTMVQTLFVNGTTTSVTSGTYTALTFASTLVGYGYGTFAQQFIGKIDDFRYYGRVITPMEMRVLNSYSYGKTGFASLTPSLGTITVGTLTVSSVPLTFTNTGTYSYMGIKRLFAGVTSTFNINPSSLVLGGSNYTWTDSVAFTSNPSVSYVITPYILGTPGLSQALTATIPAPGAISSVTAYNAGVGVFDLSWIGGVGIGVTYTYDVSSSGAIVASGNYTTTALGTTNPTRITLTDTSVKTYTVVVKATNAIGTVVSATSATITTTSPINPYYNMISTTGLLAYLPFNNDLNNYATGYSVTMPGMTPGNSPLFVTSTNGNSGSTNSIYFNNSGTYATTTGVNSGLSSQQYLYFTNSSNPISTATGVTVCMWIYFKSTPSNTNDLLSTTSYEPTFFTLGNTTTQPTNGNNYMSISLNKGSGFGASSIGGNNGSVGIYYPNSMTLTNDTWYHIAYVCNTGIIYVNGSAGTEAGNYSFGSTTIYPMYIGTPTFYESSNPFNGYIEHLRVYTRNLTAGEISTLYTNKC